MGFVCKQVILVITGNILRCSTEVSPEAEAMSQADPRYTESPTETETVFATQTSSGARDSSNNNTTRRDEVQSVYINNSHPLSEV